MAVKGDATDAFISLRISLTSGESPIDNPVALLKLSLVVEECGRPLLLLLLLLLPLLVGGRSL